MTQQQTIARVAEATPKHYAKGNTLPKQIVITLNDFKQALTSVYEEGEKNAAKAFGGCKKCYGKGYSTVIDSTTYHADFPGDKTYTKPNNPMRFCSCDRGEQLEALTNQNK